MKMKLMIAAAVLSLSTGFASAAAVVTFGFDGLTLPSTAGTTPPTPTSGSYSADTGTGAVTGLHAASATVWSTPAGNGTAKSFSSNTWSVGDYYQFSANLTGVTGVQFVFDGSGSNTGPRDFKLQYSSNGGTSYTDFATYTMANTVFSSLTPVSGTPPHFQFDLSSIAALNNNAADVFRLVDTSAVAINGAAVAVAGSSRVDNVQIGSSIITPEPTTLAAIAGASILGLRRRRA